MSSQKTLQIKFPEYGLDLLKPARYKIFYGGRGGGKSWAFAIALLSIGMSRPIRVLCARELQVSIADSVHKLLSDVISANAPMQSFYTVTQKAIVGKNGTEFSFKGLKHNVSEIKSYEGVDYCWVEEAQTVSDKSWETLIPTIRKDNSEIWISFNPKNATDPTWNRFVINKRDNSIVRKVNWADNPFFPAVLNDERMHLLKTDPVAYQHIWEGDFDTRYSGAVYAKFVKHEQITNRVKHDPDYPVYTAWDKGYGDATSIIFYQVGNNEIFIIDYFEDNQQDTRYYCEVLAGRRINIKQRDNSTGDVMAWEYGEDIPAHAHRKAYRYAPIGHFVPHDAGMKLMEAGGRSVVDQASKFGVKMFVIPATSHMNSEEALRAALPRCWINADRCGDLVQSLMSYHYKWDEDRQRYGDKPYHDWSSNACDSAEIMARTWREKIVDNATLDRRQIESDFHSKRRIYNIEQQDPYRMQRK